MSDMLIIDCHAHLYGEDPSKYPTIDNPLRPPPGKGTIAHRKEEMKAAGVRYVTGIHTSSFCGWDNRFTANAARENSEFMVGVVTLNPDDLETPQRAEQYVRDYNVRGLRVIRQKPTDQTLDDRGVDRLWATAGRLGVVMNVALNPEKHLELAAIAKRYPNVPIMLDHCLNLSAGPGDVPQELLAHPSMVPGRSGRAVTLDTLFALSKLANVYAKLSCVGTGSQQVYPCRDMHDDCRAVIDAFGPQRCVWGSGFPCEVWCANVSYAEHLRIFTHELGLDQQAQRAILGETARRLWFQR